MAVKFVSYRPEIVDGVQGATNRALEIIGGKAESYAKALCPVDTGRLRNSITRVQMDEETEVIGTNVEYAPHVELGTYKQRAQPYLRPAAENHGEEYRQVIESELRKIQNTP